MKKPKPIVPTEHQEQVALFQWLEIAAKRDDRLSMAFAIPNGGARHPVVAAKLKAEGVKSGVPHRASKGLGKREHMHCESCESRAQFVEAPEEPIVGHDWEKTMKELDLL